jgi:hypothetical protein
MPALKITKLQRKGEIDRETARLSWSAAIIAASCGFR